MNKQDVLAQYNEKVRSIMDYIKDGKYFIIGEPPSLAISGNTINGRPSLVLENGSEKIAEIYDGGMRFTIRCLVKKNVSINGRVESEIIEKISTLDVQSN